MKTYRAFLDERAIYNPVRNRYIIKNGKAIKDNPTTLDKDKPNHVWAQDEKSALKKYKQDSK